MAKKKETKSNRPSVVYRDIATGKIYTTMPKGLSKQQIADKVKHSLKYVPSILSTILGGAAIGNNIRNEQMR